MTDGELTKAAAKILRLNKSILWVMRHEITNHPNGQALNESLQQNGVGYDTDVASIAHDHLLHPDQWYIDIDGRSRFIRG